MGDNAAAHRLAAALTYSKQAHEPWIYELSLPSVLQLEIENTHAPLRRPWPRKHCVGNKHVYDLQLLAV